MHLLIIVETIGGYHAARFAATDRMFRQYGDRISVLQVSHSTQEHPWGSIPINFHAVTSPHPEEDWEMLLDQLQPDALAIPGWGFWYSRRALKWARSHHKPAIILSESKADDAPRHWIKERYKKWRFVRHFSAALVGCETHGHYLESLGLRRDQIFLGYDAVDNDYFSTETSRLRQINKAHPDLPTRPYWLSVTRMIPRKNLSLLLDAYAGYRQEIGSDYAWDLVICGSGIEEKSLKAKAEKQGVASFVNFPGFKTYREIPHWYAFAQAFIHPALQEQWGLVINEACASGIPVLCSQTIGAKELVLEGINGFQFDPTSATSLIDTMTRFHRLSVEERQQMSFESRKRVEAFHPDCFALGLRKALLHGRAVF